MNHTMFMYYKIYDTLSAINLPSDSEPAMSGDYNEIITKT